MKALLIPHYLPGIGQVSVLPHVESRSVINGGHLSWRCRSGGFPQSGEEGALSGADAPLFEVRIERNLGAVAAHVDFVKIEACASLL